MLKPSIRPYHPSAEPWMSHLKEWERAMETEFHAGRAVRWLAPFSIFAQVGCWCVNGKRSILVCWYVGGCFFLPKFIASRTQSMPSDLDTLLIDPLSPCSQGESTVTNGLLLKIRLTQLCVKPHLRQRPSRNSGHLSSLVITTQTLHVWNIYLH